MREYPQVRSDGLMPEGGRIDYDGDDDDGGADDGDDDGGDDGDDNGDDDDNDDTKVGNSANKKCQCKKGYSGNGFQVTRVIFVRN